MSTSRQDDHRKAQVTQAQRDAKTKPGQVLKNGAMIVAHSPVLEATDFACEYVVLALNENAFQPYITWRRVIGVEQKPNGSYGPGVDYCWSGDYHRSIIEALRSYTDRIAQFAVQPDDTGDAA